MYMNESDQKINRLYDDRACRYHSNILRILYKMLGTKFDFYFFESETAPKVSRLVKAHPEVFEQSDGAIVYKGEQDGLHTRVFITSKGLPTYETKDLGLAKLKAEKWPFDRFDHGDRAGTSGLFRGCSRGDEKSLAGNRAENHSMFRTA